MTGQTYTFTGLRVSAQIEKGTYPNNLNAHITVWGLSLDHINALSVCGLVYQQRQQQDVVQVSAGDADTGMSVVYIGQILEAAPDFNQPDSPLRVFATGAADLQLKPVVPNSFGSPTDAPTALQTLAGQGGWGFENNGVSTKFNSLYLPGTIWTQMGHVVRGADCYGCLDDVKGVFAIWPKKGSRTSTSGPAVLSAANGMIDYPHFQANQVIVRTLYDPVLSAQLSVGNQFVIQSQLTAANGTWSVATLNLDLSSELPGGPWEIKVTAYPETSPTGTAPPTTTVPPPAAPPTTNAPP